MPRLRRPALSALVVVSAAFALAACGIERASLEATTPAPAAEGKPPANQVPPRDPSVPLPGPQPLPDVTVTTIGTGEPVRLSDLATGDGPLLVWFWAPRCATCNVEASDIERLSADHGDELTVVGLGAKDSLDEAREFVSRHGVTTPLMVYDAGFASWKHFGIDGSPAAILFDREGVARERWFGPFEGDAVLEKARAL